MHIIVSIELSNEFGKNILSLMDYVIEGLYRECANLQSQLVLVAKAER